MHIEDLLPAAHIRRGHCDLPVKTPRTQDRRIEDIDAVCRRHHDDSLIRAKPVHLHEHLVQCLLALVVAAAHAGAAPSCHRVDLIDEDDARRILLCLRKQIPHPRRADAHEHLHEVRTRYREKRDVRLTRDRLCQQRLAGTRRTLQQHTFGNPRADLRVLAGILQEIHDLLEIFLLFFQTCHILQGDLPACHEARPALSEIHHLAAAVSRILGVHHAEHKHHDNEQHQQREQLRDKPVLLRHIPDDRFYIVALYDLLRLDDIRYIEVSLLVILQRDAQHACRHLRIRVDLHIHDKPFLHLGHKLSHRVGTAASAVGARPDQHQHQDQYKYKRQINSFRTFSQFLSPSSPITIKNQSNSTTPIYGRFL